MVATHSPRNIIPCEHPTKSPGPRVWSVPKDPIEKSRWNPVWLHLKGCPRGVCRGHGERFLPFVSVDLDRHGGEVLAKDHCQAVLATSRLLKKDFGYLTWLVEVNPKNGSTKFFGFAGRPIPVDQATKLSEKIHGSLIANGIGKREVFPFNSPQVFLPMREGKVTIIDTGVLRTCERRRDNRHGKRERFQTYSTVAFVEWLQRTRSFDDRTLERVVISACLQLADKSKTVVPKFAFTPSAPTKTPIKTVSTPEKLRKEPDSFIRQREALLEFCRRNRRVVSVKEGLEFIKVNHLFTGSWEENRAKRRVRVAQILAYVAQTFDPSLCTGVRHEINFGKFNDWAKRHCFDPGLFTRPSHLVQAYKNEGVRATEMVTGGASTGSRAHRPLSPRSRFRVVARFKAVTSSEDGRERAAVPRHDAMDRAVFSIAWEVASVAGKPVPCPTTA